MPGIRHAKETIPRIVWKKKIFVQAIVALCLHRCGCVLTMKLQLELEINFLSPLKPLSLTFLVSG